MPRVRLLVLALVAAVVLTSCGWLPFRSNTDWTGAVGDRDLLIEVGGVSVAFPTGVAPSGTRATIHLTQDERPAPDRFRSLSDSVELSLTDGLQPQQPVTIAIPLAEDVDAAALGEAHLLLVEATSADGSLAYSQGTLDVANRTVTATVDHFTGFRILGLDLRDLMGEVRTAIMQGLGLEYPAPDCVGEQASVKGTKYDVVSTPATHLCVEESDGDLVLTAHPGTAMPYVLATNPRTDGSTTATEASVTTATMVALARALGFTGQGGRSAVLPGTTARHVFDGAPTSVDLTLEQYPALLLMSILAKTLDTLGIGTIEELEKLRCLSDVAGTVHGSDDGVSGDDVGAFVRSFFSCAGTMGMLNPLGKVVLAALASGPAFVVTSVVGIVNEFTGQATHRVELTVTAPPRPKATIVLGEGGALTLNGTFLGRGGPSEVAALVTALGPAEAARTFRCTPQAPEMVERSWGGLVIYSLVEQFADEGSPATWEAGGISGWEWRAGGPAGITGPKGIRLGAAGSDVLAKYRADDIFSVWDDPTSISAFAGDTTDITFRLDSAGKVSAMEAGWGCDPAR